MQLFWPGAATGLSPAAGNDNHVGDGHRRPEAADTAAERLRRDVVYSWCAGIPARPLSHLHLVSAFLDMVQNGHAFVGSIQNRPTALEQLLLLAAQGSHGLGVDSHSVSLPPLGKSPELAPQMPCT